jgi:Antirestriction protein (ArdA).
MSKKIRVRANIANLRKYNEGKIVSKWITFPISRAELNRVFDEIGLNDEYPEYTFLEWESNNEYLLLEKYEDIESINRVAEVLDTMSDTEYMALNVYVEEIGGFNDAIEMIQNKNYVFYENMTMEDLARSFVQSTNPQEFILRYFNYELYASDLLQENNYYEGRDGVLYIQN